MTASSLLTDGGTCLASPGHCCSWQSSPANGNNWCGRCICDIRTVADHVCFAQYDQVMLPACLCCSTLQLPSGFGCICRLPSCFLRHGHHLFDWHCGCDTVSNHFSASCWCQQGLFTACLSRGRAASHQVVKSPRLLPSVAIDQLHIDGITCKIPIRHHKTLRQLHTAFSGCSCSETDCRYRSFSPLAQAGAGKPSPGGKEGLCIASMALPRITTKSARARPHL